MDASLQSRAEQLASEMAGQARTIEDLNGLMRLMMKSALERMLNTEMDVHLGRRASPACEAPAAETPAPEAEQQPAPAPEAPAEAAAEETSQQDGQAAGEPEPETSTDQTTAETSS